MTSSTPSPDKDIDVVVLVAGVALFSDGYNIRIIGYMNSVLAKLYPSVMTTEVKQLNSYCGDVLGMIFFNGLCIDRWGRRLGIFAITFFLVFGIVLATAAHGTTLTSMSWMMVIWRGVAGVGAGGEYAVCTTQAIEAADESAYAATSTNCATVSGFVASSIVSVLVLLCYNGKTSDGVWRVCFGIGILLPLTIFFFRMRLVDSTQYRKHAIKRCFPLKLAVRRYWKALLGCCGTWFLYDFIVYPFNLLAPDPNPNPTTVSGFSSSTSLVETTGCGYLHTETDFRQNNGFLIDWIVRRQTYALGFAIVSVFGFIIGGAMIPLRQNFPAFSFLSVGPGNCNFLVASESFPTPVRGHFLGLAAAVGKAGAAIGTQVFPLIVDRYGDEIKGQQAIFLIGAAISVVGTLMVYFLIPDKDRQLESEDKLFKEYLEQNGWDTSDMGSI
ncbi:MFS general substrate transporter [Dendrothele bispora CBS 962.96]|uniref:MFS general substrate transporter n=1 Tax=Dendrothele bispora (strain CBS 962.96) TaxID=1314807 RepID=A0A4V4HIY4_DENBC|nr:MFS general substrate transporter [Dendrothele bispora CBS 962.96]